MDPPQMRTGAKSKPLPERAKPFRAFTPTGPAGIEGVVSRCLHEKSRYRPIQLRAELGDAFIVGDGLSHGAAERE
jgi:hypothetical protein